MDLLGKFEFDLSDEANNKGHEMNAKTLEQWKEG